MMLLRKSHPVDEAKYRLILESGEKEKDSKDDNNKNNDSNNNNNNAAYKTDDGDCSSTYMLREETQVENSDKINEGNTTSTYKMNEDYRSESKGSEFQVESNQNHEDRLKQTFKKHSVTLEKKLGAGGFGEVEISPRFLTVQVWKAIYQGEEVAVKMLKKQSALDEIKDEMGMLG